MAYIILTSNGEEIDRRELNGVVTIGRAHDCDIKVHDILMSRHHCRIEPVEKGWVVSDLQSKNGTFLGNWPVSRYLLKDGDELRMGRTRLTFRAGAYEPAPRGSRRETIVRPADPNEAMAATVSGMDVSEGEELKREQGKPFPQPKPWKQD